MSVQNLIDRFTTTLASGYTSGGGSLSVTSASGLPTGACSFLAIVLAETSNTEEVFLVTNVSGTTLTVTGAQAGSSASNHASGATVIAGIITSAMLKQLCPILLQEQTASNSTTLDFDATAGFAWYSTSFDIYEIKFVNVLLDTTNLSLQMRVSTNGGSSYDSGGNYNSNALQFLSGGTGTSGGGGAQTLWTVSAANSVVAGQPGVCGSLTMYSPGSGARKNLSGLVTYSDVNGDPRLLGNVLAFQYQSTTAFDGVRFLVSSTGKIASGTIRIYGIPK